MKVKLGNLFYSQDDLRELSTLKNAPVKTSLQIARLLRAIEPELNTVVNERNKLIMKHGEEEGGKTTVKEGTEAFVNFLKDVGELFEQEIELDCAKVKLPSEVCITPRLLLNLEELFDIER